MVLTKLIFPDKDAAYDFFSQLLFRDGARIFRDLGDYWAVEFFCMEGGQWTKTAFGKR